MQFQQRFYGVLMPLMAAFNYKLGKTKGIFEHVFAHFQRLKYLYINVSSDLPPYKNSLKKLVCHMRQWHCSGSAAHGTGRRGYF